MFNKLTGDGPAYAKLEALSVARVQCVDGREDPVVSYQKVEVVKGTGVAHYLLDEKLTRILAHLCRLKYKAQDVDVSILSSTGVNDGSYTERKFKMPRAWAGSVRSLFESLDFMQYDIWDIRDVLKKKPKPPLTTSILQDININNNWTLAKGLRFSNPTDDKDIRTANQDANNLLATAIAASKEYAVDLIDGGNQEIQANGSALVPVSRSIVALLPVILSLFKGMKLPVAILLDTIGGIIRELVIEQIKQRVIPKQDAIAAVPEWWQVRVGNDRPQSVVFYAEITATGLG